MGNQTVAGSQFVNSAAYKFAPLRDLKKLRADLQACCKAWGLKGSILLSTEGIHLAVSGGAEENERLLQRLRAIEGLESLSPKVSQSATPPFRRMLVLIRKEIVSLGVDGLSQLHRSAGAQCAACLTPLTEEEQRDETYEEGRSCRYCFKSSDKEMRDSIAVRQQAIAELTETLPGSEPYNQARPIRIPEKYDGDLLLGFLTRKFRHLTRDFWQGEIEGKRLCNADREPVKADQIVRVGERYFRISSNESEPPVNSDVRLLFEDEAIVVIEKPAPLPVHPCGRFNRNTLQFFLDKVYAPQKPHIAHRLDADTTGLMVVARTKHFATRLQPQFACGQVHKTYLARVHGSPLEDRFVCDLALSDGLSANGKREAASDGLVARTEFTVLKRFEDGTALLEVRPITGRTNQIRIHLWELGFPICGDPRYLPGRRLGKVQSKTITDTPLCLHSKSIEFFHPLSQERMKFEKADVAWAVSTSLG